MEKVVGNLSNENSGLKNMYWRTSEGLLIPHPVYFFGDSCAHAVGDVRAVIRVQKDLKEMGVRDALIADDLEYYDELNAIGNKSKYEANIHNLKCVIDEVLDIASNENSFGLVKTGFRGYFDERSLLFFNAQSLRTLFYHACKTHFDFDKQEPTPAYGELINYWLELREKDHSFASKNREYLDG